MDCNMPGFPLLHYLPEFVLIHVHWVNDADNHLILCHSFLILPTIFPSIRVFTNESAPLSIRCPNYWSFSFSMSASNEYSGLISFMIDWFDLLFVKGFSRVFSSTTVWKHQFFSTQLSLWSNSHPYMTTGKTTVGLHRSFCFSRWTSVGSSALGKWVKLSLNSPVSETFLTWVPWRPSLETRAACGEGR